MRGLTIRGYGTAYLAGDFDIQSTIGLKNICSVACFLEREVPRLAPGARLKVHLGVAGKVALSVAALIFPFGGLG